MADRPSVEFLRECFDYRDGLLYWRERPAHHFQKPADCAAFNTKTAGKLAGKLDGRGYYAIGLRINGKAISMAAHRVVWALHHGRWPTLHIDHINRLRDDNRIENLREVTQAENAKNSARNRVFPYVVPHYHGRFTAQVKLGAGTIYLGIFDSEQEANAHRLMVLGELEKVARSLVKRTPRPTTYRKRRPMRSATLPPSPTEGDRA